MSRFIFRLGSRVWCLTPLIAPFFWKEITCCTMYCLVCIYCISSRLDWREGTQRSLEPLHPQTLSFRSFLLTTPQGAMFNCKVLIRDLDGRSCSTPLPIPSEASWDRRARTCSSVRVPAGRPTISSPTSTNKAETPSLILFKWMTELPHGE